MVKACSRDSICGLYFSAFDQITNELAELRYRSEVNTQLQLLLERQVEVELEGITIHRVLKLILRTHQV